MDTRPATIVAGIDPGSNATGYCSLKVQGMKYTLLHPMETLQLRGRNRIDRLRDLGERLTVLLERDRPSYVAVEAGSVHSDTKYAVSALITAQARGICLYVASRVAGVVDEVPVQSARAALGVAGWGQGREAGKSKVMYVICALLQPEYAPNIDAAEAAALAVWEANRVASRATVPF